MRKCIDLESQPGFQQIYSPVMQQAIDRGLEGHSGEGVIDWGYDLDLPGTAPTEGGPKPTKRPSNEPKIPTNLTDPVVTGGGTHYDNIFNRYVTRAARKIINKFFKPTIRGYNNPRIGSYAPHRGRWGHIKTTRGWGGEDSATLIHEYGHALDNIIGMLMSGTDEKMSYSERILKGMEIDGKKLGLILDDKIYWSYLREKGISFRPDPNGKRKITFNPVAKNRVVSDARFRQETESKMHGGDHWRIMAEMLRVTKEDMNKANLSKDPVQMLRTKKWHDAVAKLYDAHIARMEKVKKIRARATVLLKKAKKENPFNRVSGDEHHFSHLGDIIDALTGGEIVDWEKANDVYWQKGAIVSTFGHHGSGYYSMRRMEERNGDYKYPQHYNMRAAMENRRAEVWAQMFTFWSSNSKNFQQFVATLMPSISKDFNAAMNLAAKFKMGTSSINLNRNQSPDLSQAETGSPVFRSANPNMNRPKLPESFKRKYGLSDVSYVNASELPERGTGMNKTMMDSIAEDGVLLPILLVKDWKGGPQVVDGVNRVEIAKTILDQTGEDIKVPVIYTKANKFGWDDIPKIQEFIRKLWYNNSELPNKES
jgi:hypothetical protein